MKVTSPCMDNLPKTLEKCSIVDMNVTAVVHVMGCSTYQKLDPLKAKLAKNWVEISMRVIFAFCRAISNCLLQVVDPKEG